MSTIRKSQLRQVVECINDNAVDILSNVAKAVYLGEHQSLIYMEGRMATVIREVLPEGQLNVEAYIRRDVHEWMTTTYEYAVSFMINGIMHVHCVRVRCTRGEIHDNMTPPVDTWKLVEQSSWPRFVFEDAVYEFGDQHFNLLAGDPAINSSEFIVLWEERMLEALQNRFQRDSFEVSLTISHGRDIAYTVSVEDVSEGYQVTLEYMEKIIEDPVAELPAEVVIGTEEDGQDPERNRIYTKMTTIATTALVDTYLAIEDRLPDEAALYAIQYEIEKKLTQELNDLKFSVSVSYYLPIKSVNVAVIELGRNITVSLVAKRK